MIKKSNEFVVFIMDNNLECLLFGSTEGQEYEKNGVQFKILSKRCDVDLENYTIDQEIKLIVNNEITCIIEMSKGFDFHCGDYSTYPIGHLNKKDNMI